MSKILRIAPKKVQDRIERLDLKNTLAYDSKETITTKKGFAELGFGGQIQLTLKQIFAEKFFVFCHMLHIFYHWPLNLERVP